jgi:hypothetical protein
MQAPFLQSYAKTRVNREKAMMLTIQLDNQDPLVLWFSDERVIGFKHMGAERPTVLDVVNGVDMRRAGWIDGGGPRAISRRLPPGIFEGLLGGALMDGSR